MDANAYARQLKQLLPPGSLFQLEPGSKLSKLLLAIADELARVDGRASDLLEEWDPQTTTEMIEDWERQLGLPDEFVTTIPGTIEERRIAVTQKFTSRGGQNDAFFTALALLCGYTVTIHNYGRAGELSRCGATCGALMYAPSVWGWTIRLDIAAPLGDVLPEADFERVMTRALHSYASIVFNYL